MHSRLRRELRVASELLTSARVRDLAHIVRLNPSRSANGERVLIATGSERNRCMSTYL